MQSEEKTQSTMATPSDEEPGGTMSSCPLKIYFWPSGRSWNTSSVQGVDGHLPSKHETVPTVRDPHKAVFKMHADLTLGSTSYPRLPRIRLWLVEQRAGGAGGVVSTQLKDVRAVSSPAVPPLSWPDPRSGWGHRGRFKGRQKHQLSLFCTKKREKRNLWGRVMKKRSPPLSPTPPSLSSDLLTGRCWPEGQKRSRIFLTPFDRPLESPATLVE